MPLTLRAVTEKDIEPIARLEAKCFRMPWTEADIRAALRRFDFYGLTVEEDGAVVGFLLGSLLFENAEVYRVAVDPEKRGKGIGGRILDRFLQDVKEGGAEQALLEVRVSNEAGIALYNSRGFGVARIRKNYYEGVEDALEMVKFLY